MSGQTTNITEKLPLGTLVAGGFLHFQSSYPNLCVQRGAQAHFSQPCLPVANVGPTRILSFMYLGSQQDALDEEVLRPLGISYLLTISKAATKPDWVRDERYLRIPVDDSMGESILPWFNAAFCFIDKVKESNGCLLVHCMAGISRSATVAIGYVMANLNLTFDEAHRYVKDKRPTIAPNFNFLGQLLEFEHELSQKRCLMQSSRTFNDRLCESLTEPLSPPFIQSRSKSMDEANEKEFVQAKRLRKTPAEFLKPLPVSRPTCFPKDFGKPMEFPSSDSPGSRKPLSPSTFESFNKMVESSLQVRTPESRIDNPFITALSSPTRPIDSEVKVSSEMVKEAEESNNDSCNKRPKLHTSSPMNISPDQETLSVYSEKVGRENMDPRSSGLFSGHSIYNPFSLIGETITELSPENIVTPQSFKTKLHLFSASDTGHDISSVSSDSVKSSTSAHSESAVTDFHHAISTLNKPISRSNPDNLSKGSSGRRSRPCSYYEPHFVSDESILPRSQSCNQINHDSMERHSCGSQPSLSSSLEIIEVGS